MTQPFLITGLPRSRTAWFALLCSGLQEICWHEPTQHGQWQDVCSGIWNCTDAPFVGISDSALGFNLSNILLEYKPRTVIIDRKISDVSASLAKQGITGIDRYLKALYDILWAAHNHPYVKWVRYEDLDDQELIIECMDWLMPGGMSHAQRAKHFMDFKIEKKIDWAAVKEANLESMIGKKAHAALRAN